MASGYELKQMQGNEVMWGGREGQPKVPHRRENPPRTEKMTKGLILMLLPS